MNKFILFILVIFFFFPPKAYGQDEKDPRIKLLEDIKLLQHLIDESGDSITTTYRLNLINSRIARRQAYIRTINNEIDEIQNEIDKNNRMYERLTKELNNSKNEYSKLVQNAYKSKTSSTYQTLMFILSADNFYQSYLRYKYLQQLTDYRQQQIQLIKENQRLISRLNKELKKQKRERMNLLKMKNVESEKLYADRNRQKRIKESLSTKNDYIRQRFEQKQANQKKLTSTVLDEILFTVNSASDSARKKTEKPSSLTPQHHEFEKWMGKLPWPVEKGFIVNPFGVVEHPVLKGVYITNDGIDIGTFSGTMVKAIFPGKVTKVISLAGNYYAILIKHGKYYTLYSRLASVSIQKGDTVQMGEIIGLIYTDINNNQTVLQFQIWKQNDKLDPEKWLSENFK